MTEKLPRTALTLRQHGKLQIHRKRIKVIQSYVNLGNTQTLISIQTRQTDLFFELVLIFVCAKLATLSQSS